MQTVSMNAGLSSAIDASRWIAALLVAVSHIHHLVLANFEDVHNATLLWKAAYFCSSFGTEAVIVFFVVSGFLVGGLTTDKFLRAPGTGATPTIASYFVQRFARIYTVLVPALCVGLAFDVVGYKWFDGSHLYSDSSQYHTISLDMRIVAGIDATTLLGNLLMLGNISVPVLGSNGPLWSLAYEWWYYCIFAALLGVSFRTGVQRWIGVAFIAAALALLPTKLLLWMLMWLVGMGAYFYIRSALPKPHPILGLAALLAALCFSRFNHGNAGPAMTASAALFNQFVREMVLALAFAFALTGFSRLQHPLAGARLHAALAGFSYSLYLVHFPAMLFLVAAGAQLFGLPFIAQPALASYEWFAAILLSVCVFAYAFSLVTERNTNKVASWLRRFVPASPVIPTKVPG